MLLVITFELDGDVIINYFIFATTKNMYNHLVLLNTARNDKELQETFMLTQTLFLTSTLTLAVFRNSFFCISLQCLWRQSFVILYFLFLWSSLRSLVGQKQGLCKQNNETKEKQLTLFICLFHHFFIGSFTLFDVVFRFCTIVSGNLKLFKNCKENHVKLGFWPRI